MAERDFTKKSRKRVTTPTVPAKSMDDLLSEEEPVVEPVKMPDAKKNVHIEYELNEKLRLLVFQKKYTTERAVFEAALKLLFKQEKI